MKDPESSEMTRPVLSAQKNPPDMLVPLSIALYATCSSLMLVVNKVAVHFLPAPAVVLLFQLITTAGTVWFCGRLGVIEHDKLEWQKVKGFGLVSVAFVAAVFTNMKTLQFANVETFVIFRSSTPLVISFMDWAFLGRKLPSARSWASLLLILCGAVGYVLTDASFEVKGYFWVCIWFLVFTFDQVYIKYACDTVKMSNWGRVYYTNLLSCLPVCLLLVCFREYDEVTDWIATRASGRALSALALSCLCGIGMSYTGFFCRTNVSATMFTVVGIICKVATIIINCMIWEKHASSVGLAFLSLCLVAGSFYQQAPMRDT
uniref:Sugar phosphate transporter domain-containing protein n=1 Tax=Tetraselmis sp. GSL018 TaxID=582737 RepID=A0A061R5V7_9CHLO